MNGLIEAPINPEPIINGVIIGNSSGGNLDIPISIAAGISGLILHNYISAFLYVKKIKGYLPPANTGEGYTYSFGR